MVWISKSIISFIIIIPIFNNSISQEPPYPYDVKKYSYIRYLDNRFQFFNDSAAFVLMYEKYFTLAARGEGNINIIHIGGSHIQADVYTHRVRERIQTIYNSTNSARGFVFPYKIAKTNNPKNFETRYSGLWRACSNIDNSTHCRLGLSGMAITTYDTTSSIFVAFPSDNELQYQFNRVKIFHEQGDEYFNFEIEAPGKQFISTNDSMGYTEVIFDQFLGGLLLKVVETDTAQSLFTLYGISLESDEPGILYHSIGVNGASIPSYLECALFSQHMKALAPDLVVISLGTNDAYTRNFNQEVYKQNYIELLKRVKNAAPNAAILLTVPNDSYLYRRYINTNTEKMEGVIIELAKEYGYGVWDFYHIMGGLNSAYVWHKDGLMQYDRVHFTREGYLLKGDLFFNAFLKGFDDYVDNKALGTRH